MLPPLVSVIQMGSPPMTGKILPFIGICLTSLPYLSSKSCSRRPKLSLFYAQTYRYATVLFGFERHRINTLNCNNKTITLQNILPICVFFSGTCRSVIISLFILKCLQFLFCIFRLIQIRTNMTSAKMLARKSIHFFINIVFTKVRTTGIGGRIYGSPEVQNTNISRYEWKYF